MYKNVDSGKDDDHELINHKLISEPLARLTLKVLHSKHLSSEKLENVNEPRHAIMCLREINNVMRYDVVKSDVVISRRA